MSATSTATMKRPSNFSDKPTQEYADWVAEFIPSFAPVRDLADVIETSWLGGQPMVVCAGMRSGKTVLANYLGAKSKHFIVAVSQPGEYFNYAQHKSRRRTSFMACIPNSLDHFESLVDVFMQTADPETTAIVIESAFWRSRMDGFALFDLAQRYTKRVLAIDSLATPAHMRQWGKAEIMLKCPTWSLAPAVTPKSLVSEFERNREHAIRDYGSGVDLPIRYKGKPPARSKSR